MSKIDCYQTTQQKGKVKENSFHDATAAQQTTATAKCPSVIHDQDYYCPAVEKKTVTETKRKYKKIL